MKTYTVTIFMAIAGLLLAAAGLTGLTRGQGDDALRYHRNPFALEGSGYGKLLAQLSQDTINKVWHIGVERVNPHGHDHGDCDHGHGHCDHSDHSDHSDSDSDLTDEELLALLDEVAAEGHGGCDHDHGQCDHDAGDDAEPVESTGWITSAKDRLVDLKSTRYERTNDKGMSEAHRLAVAGDIENMFLRSYRMDPTDFGVYNGYFLFLTIHNLRATPRARDHARLVSRNTIAAASREDTDPSPWMTAAMAVLNLFFLDMEDWGADGARPPARSVEDYKLQMDHCLRQFAVLKQKAIHEKRWEAIPVDRRADLEEREQFARKTFKQFDMLLARVKADNEGTRPATSEPSERVAENTRDGESS